MLTNAAERLLAESNDFEGATHLVEVEGMSSPRVCRLLNGLVASMDPGESYLEVGLWKGLTLLSAAYGNKERRCFGCDRFRLWGRYTGWGFRARRALAANVERYRDQCAQIQLFEMPSERLFERHLVPGPVGVYFYDGDHTYEGTRAGILEGARLLSRRAVVLVDDFADPSIRHGTFEAIYAANLQILWSRFLGGWNRGFWHGLGVFYVERSA